MVKIEALAYSVGKKQILRDVSTTFNRGSCTVILGPNGSGKSSLLKICSGEISNYRGKVIFNDKELQSISKSKLARERAVMSQEPELHFPLAVEEVIMMGRYPHFNYEPHAIDHAICNEVAARMGLLQLKERNYLTLSGGEKQRVHFARVLAQIWQQEGEPAGCLFLDEPTAGLDPFYQHELLQIVRGLTEKGFCVIAVLHNINLAIQYAHELFFLKEGEMVIKGSPEEVISTKLIQDIFNIPVRIQPGTDNKPMVVYQPTVGSSHVRPR